MKKAIAILFTAFLCVFADNERIFHDTVEVYSFRVENTTKRVVAHWYEDKENITTVVQNPVRNAFWAVSHGGFLSYPVINLMKAGVGVEWFGMQNTLLDPNRDNTKLLPTYIYKIFTNTTENYDSILRGDWSFINLLPMEMNELASQQLLNHLNSETTHDSLAVNVDFVRIFDSQKKIKFLDSLNMTLDSFYLSCPPIWDWDCRDYNKWVYFVKASKENVWAAINSGVVTSISLNINETSKIVNSVAIAGKRQGAAKFSVAVANNTLRFSQKLPNNSDINIYSPNGRMVYSSKLSGNSHKLPNMARGVYLLRITDANKAVVFNGKIIF